MRFTSTSSALICLVVLAAVLAPPATAGAADDGAQPHAAGAAEDTPATTTAPSTAATGGTQDPSQVAPAARDEVLPPTWRSSDDVAWTLAGDQTGLHVLVAAEAEAYTWHTVASLREPGIETDRWIGNACLTESGTRLAVAYAPRAFTNEAQLSQRGAYTAVVDLGSGEVSKPAVRSSLAYFSPGCGAGEQAVFTQERGHEQADDTAATRLITVDARTGAAKAAVVLDGQVTSAVPTPDGVVAAAGARMVAVGRDGTLETLTPASSVPFDLTVESGGGVVFIEQDGDQAVVRHLPRADKPGAARELARAGLRAVDVVDAPGGRVLLTGRSTRQRSLPAAVQHVAVPADAELSTEGHLAIVRSDRSADATGEAAARKPAKAWAASRTLAEPTDIDTPRQAELHARIVQTGAKVDFTVQPHGRVSTARNDQSHPLHELAGAPASSRAVVADSTIDAAGSCAVPRNDPQQQVYQPTPRQVEWAVNQAVTGNLFTTRSPWSPQALFPPRDLVGGGRVPSQVMLGILAQESNLWQASGHALSGVRGNPLIGNFYGREVYDDDASNDWDIDFDDADCGYGVSQMTDGMRKAGRERPGETALPAEQQRAIALDYASNIAAGLRVLQDKWNQTRSVGLVHSDGDWHNIENWYFAIWAYNSGFHPQSEASQHNGAWGVGWLNNPVNPRYDRQRGLFNEDPHDPAHPEDWPYQEKVIGFAAFSIATIDGPGFRPAWWTETLNRSGAQAPVNHFCDERNTCDPGALIQPTDPEVADEPPGPCAHRNSQGQYDLKCWWNQPTTFNDCALSQCGYELLRFDSSYPEQPDGTHYPPRCNAAALPANALIVDDVPASVPSRRPDCAKPWANSGTFTLDFEEQPTGRVDLHQIGGGLGGHFWFAHTRYDGRNGNRLKATGTWRLDRSLDQWARVFVHIPDHGAHTQQARYEVSLGNGTTKHRYVLQRWREHTWVPLGVFRFRGTPRVSLSTVTLDGHGEEDIAWDAIAVQPLAGKPRHFVVGMGDSFSSGEGAGDYFTPSDNNYGNLSWNACRRSRHAWIRGAVLPGAVATIGQQADAFNNNIDLAFLACSGGRTRGLLGGDNPKYWQTNSLDDMWDSGENDIYGASDSAGGQFREIPQIDAGYLDENTTLVALTFGGNNVDFAKVLGNCGIQPGCHSDEFQAEIMGNIEADQQTLVTVMERIHSRAPNAQIVLMGYPRVFAPDAQCTSSAATWDDSEVAFLNEMADYIAEQQRHTLDVLRSRSTSPIPVSHGDVRDLFAEHGACNRIGTNDQGQPVYGNEWLNRVLHGPRGEGDTPTIDLDNDNPGCQLGLLCPTSRESFHPNQEGTAGYADGLERTLADIGYRW